MIRYKDKIFKNESELYNYALTLVASDCVACSYEDFAGKLKLRIPVHEAIVFARKPLEQENQKENESTQAQTESDSKSKSEKKISKKKSVKKKQSYEIDGVGYKNLTLLYKAMLDKCKNPVSYSHFRDRVLFYSMPANTAIDKNVKRKRTIANNIGKKITIQTENGTIETNIKGFWEKFGITWYNYQKRIKAGLSHDKAIQRINQKGFKIEGIGEFKTIRSFVEHLSDKGIRLSQLTAWRMAHGEFSEKMMRRLLGQKTVTFFFEGKKHEYFTKYEAIKKLGISASSLKNVLAGKKVHKNTAQKLR